MRGKPGNEVLNTTVTNTQTVYLFLLHTSMYSYYSTFIVAYTVLVLLDMTSLMLFCTLPIGWRISSKSSENCRRVSHKCELSYANVVSRSTDQFSVRVAGQFTQREVATFVGFKMATLRVQLQRSLYCVL